MSLAFLEVILFNNYDVIEVASAFSRLSRESRI